METIAFGNITYIQIVEAFFILLVGTFLGVIIEKIIVRQLHLLAKKTGWNGDVVLSNALKGLTTLIFFFVFLSVATSRLTVNREVSEVLGKVITTGLILIITIILARITGGFVSLYSTTEGEALPQTSIFTNVAKAIVLVIGFLVILQTLGVSITPIITALGVGVLRLLWRFRIPSRIYFPESRYLHQSS